MTVPLNLLPRQSVSESTKVDVSVWCETGGEGGETGGVVARQSHQSLPAWWGAVIVVVLCVLSLSCRAQHLSIGAEVGLFHKVAEQCGNPIKECRVDLAAVTGFAWDRVAFVVGPNNSTEVALALGVPGFRVPEFQDWIVFAYGGRIVHVEKFIAESDGEVRNIMFLSFDEMQGRDSLNPNWAVFSRSDAVFIAASSGEDVIVLSRRFGASH